MSERGDKDAFKPKKKKIIKIICDKFIEGWKINRNGE